VIPTYSANIHTGLKLLRFASLIQIPVHATTQNKARLGDLDAELVHELERKELGGARRWDKTSFSMLGQKQGDELRKALLFSSLAGNSKKASVALVGFEAHVCVTQTALDLLNEGHDVFVVADGVGSCHPQEVTIALDRLRANGCQVVSSESWMFEVMGSSEIDEFRLVLKLVKETKEGTKRGWEKILEATTVAGVVGQEKL
jgi:isochorismate hydrolase